ncbi:MAG: putative zinc-binding protein [Gemmatales bacterium]|nr:putative zinc-binding protein [Gemmatales bacterium]MDW7994777.1 putative zinc-binding protein [Gemmatales bacterium]
MSDKVVLAPCMGVGKVVANVTRRAAYLAHAACPEDTEILSLPALLAGDTAERRLVFEHPVVVIEGCVLRCASHVLRLVGAKPAAKIEVSRIIREKRLTPGRTRKELEASGKQLAQAVAERIALALADEPWGDSPAQPEAGTGCPCACSCSSSGRTPAEAPSPNQGVSQVHSLSPPAQPITDNLQSNGEPPPAQGLTLLPCQGIKRSGARIAQRTAYHLCEDEDKLLGQSQPLCVSALAAGVPEDVHYYRDFPTVALNGCPQNCATKIAELFGIPAVRSVNLYEAFPEYPCETRVLEPDLTPQESELARRWAEQLLPELQELLQQTRWQPRAHCTHGMVNDPVGIERFFGYQATSRGYDVPRAVHEPAAT